MLYSQERNELRQHFFDAWDKHQNQLKLEPEAQKIVEVMTQHPEYHDVFDNPDKHLDKDYSVELGDTNPFLHLSMHLAIREQLITNRPEGIRDVYQKLTIRYGGDHLTAEHEMMTRLAELMWQSQRNNTVPDDAEYLESLMELAE